MQFITHRDPVAQSGWSTALGATGDAINNVLGIYANYKNQQLEQKRYDRDMQMREAEAQRRREVEDRQAEHQDLMTQMQARQIRLSEIEKGLPGKRPTVQVGERQVDAAPDFQVDTNKPDAATPFGSAKLDTSLGQRAPLTQQPFALDLKQPTRSEAVMGAAPTQYEELKAIRDRRGNVLAPEMQYELRYRDEMQAEQEAAQHRKAMDIPYANLTPDQKAMLQKSSPASAALFEAQGWVPASIVDNVYAAESKRVNPMDNIKTVSGGYLTTDDKGNVVFHRTELPSGSASADAAKPLLATEITKVQDFRSGLAQLADLLDEAEGTGTTEWAKTKIPNIMTEAFGWGADAKSRQAALDTAKQIIGKAMEGGVLRKEDEAKYMKILPTIKDAPNVARDKIQRLVQLMIRDSQMYVDTLAASGRDVEDVRGLVNQSGREALVATGNLRPDIRQPAVRDPHGLLTDEEKNLGAPQANANALGLPRVRVDRGSLPRR